VNDVVTSRLIKSTLVRHPAAKPCTRGATFCSNRFNLSVWPSSMTFYIKTQVRASQKPTCVASQAFTSAYVVWTDVTSLGRVNARRLRKKLLVSTDPGAYRGGQGGPRKVPTMSQIFSSIQYICFQKTSGLNMGASNLFLVPGAISPRYAPAPIWQVWLQQGTTWLQLRKILLDCGGRS